MGDMDLMELAPRVRPAGRFDDGSIFVEMLEAGVGIGLERALVELQMLPGASTGTGVSSA